MEDRPIMIQVAVVMLEVELKPLALDGGMATLFEDALPPPLWAKHRRRNVLSLDRTCGLPWS